MPVVKATKATMTWGGRSRQSARFGEQPFLSVMATLFDSPPLALSCSHAVISMYTVCSNTQPLKLCDRVATGPALPGLRNADKYHLKLFPRHYINADRLRRGSRQFSDGLALERITKQHVCAAGRSRMNNPG